jgi:hypothetical protein
MRCLTAEEESEFQYGFDSHSAERSSLEPTLAASAEWSEGIPGTAKSQIPSRGEGETLLDFGLRFLSAHGLPQHSEPLSHTKNMGNTGLIGAVLSRFCELDTIEFRGMCAEDEWANVLGKRLRTIGGQE